MLAPTNNTDGNVTIVCTHFARSVTQGQFTPSQWPGTRMGCIIALNVDSLVAVVVGSLVQPRAPDCINGSKNTFAKSAKTSTRVGIKIHRNARSAKHVNPLKTLI